MRPSHFSLLFYTPQRRAVVRRPLDTHLSFFHSAFALAHRRVDLLRSCRRRDKASDTYQSIATMRILTTHRPRSMARHWTFPIALDAISRQAMSFSMTALRLAATLSSGQATPNSLVTRFLPLKRSHAEMIPSGTQLVQPTSVGLKSSLIQSVSLIFVHTKKAKCLF